jgi:hypothetical protein
MIVAHSFSRTMQFDRILLPISYSSTYHLYGVANQLRRLHFVTEIERRSRARWRDMRFATASGGDMTDDAVPLSGKFFRLPPPG